MPVLDAGVLAACILGGILGFVLLALTIGFIICRRKWKQKKRQQRIDSFRRAHEETSTKNSIGDEGGAWANSHKKRYTEISNK